MIGRALLVTAGVWLAGGCAPAPLVTVRREPTATGTRLTLVGAPGARINARLLPALELKDGSVLRFTSDRVTEDSSYFSADPALEVAGDPSGVVRASVCPEGERVCRRVEVVVR